MAIIRIKRTTGTSLPTGLTFGELAFIGSTGGATANRLYIAGPQGVCVWIGAEILQAPTFWSGDTADTTIPTVGAVENRITSRLSSGSVSSFNGLTGAVQGVSAMGATASTWKRLAVSFTGGYAASGATGFVNLLGTTWADSATVNTAVGGLAAGSNITGNSVLEILEKMLFAYQSATVSWGSVSTFTSGSLEIGQTAANSGNATITTSATNTSNIDTNGFTVVYSHNNTSSPSGSASNISFLGATGYATSKANINLPTAVRATTVGANFTFTARVSDYNAWVAYGSPLPTSLGETASATITATWYPRFYWGKSATDGLTDPASLSSGSSGLNTSTSGFSPSTYSISDSTTGYLYLFVHNSYTPSQIRIDNSSGSLLGLKNLTQTGSAGAGGIIGTVPTTTVTNSHGHSATYKIYQSTFTQAGAFTLFVSNA